MRNKPKGNGSQYLFNYSKLRKTSHVIPDLLARIPNPTRQ
jgi:hypothetical protein